VQDAGSDKPPTDSPSESDPDGLGSSAGAQVERASTLSSLATGLDLREVSRLLEAQRGILQQMMPIVATLRSTGLIERQLGMQRSIAALAPSLSYLAQHREMLKSMETTLAGVNLSRLRQPMIDLQMVASTAAWASALARQLGPTGFDFERMRTTLVELSGLLAVRLAVVPHTGSWLSSVRLSPIALGMTSPDIQTGVLQPIISQLRVAGSFEIERDHMAPASFAFLSASGVAGVVASAEATVTAGEAEMTILSEEVRASGIEVMRKRYPDLMRKLDGARQAIQSGNVDGVSQASNSLQELTDRTLRRLTDIPAALNWCKDKYPAGIYKTADGKYELTRAGKVRYIAHAGSFEGTVAEAVADIIVAASQILQKGKHEEVPPEVMESLLLVVEGYVGVIFAVAPDAV